MLGSGRVEGVEAAADPAGAPGSPPRGLGGGRRPRPGLDDVLGRRPGGPADACATTPPPAVASRLVLAFPGPTNVREIGVEAGLAEGDDQRAGRYRPRTLRLRLGRRRVPDASGSTTGPGCSASASGRARSPA